MSKDANSFGHDKALAWESRGFVYTKRGCIVSTHPHFITDFINSLVTKVKNNMKNSLMGIADKILLRKRALIEMVNDELKSNST